MADTTYTVQAPDGHLITIKGPAGASREEVIAQAQRLYNPAVKPKASLSATELAPGVPIPGMPSAPKVNMQYQGPVPNWINDIRGMSDSEVAAYEKQRQSNFYQMRAAQPGQAQMDAGEQRIRNAKSGDDIAGGVSDYARGLMQGMAPVALTALGGTVAGVPGAWNKVKLLGQVIGNVAVGAGAGAATEQGLKSVGAGDGYAQAGGDIASILAPAGAMKLYDYLTGKLPNVGPVIKNKNTPQRQEQVDMLKNMGVQLDKGQENNNSMARRMAQSGQTRFGSSGMAQDFYQNQERQLANASQRVVDAGTPTQNYPLAGGNSSSEAYPSGQALLDRLNSRITQAKSYADKMYDSVRGSAARNVKTVQTGERTIPASSIVDQFGAPAIPEHTVPVMSKIETPVNLAPVRQQLAEVYSDLARNLPPVQQQNNPAFNALKSMMESDQAQMPAVDFDRFLGAVKAITREGSSPFLTNQSQGLAKQVVKAGETQLKDALSGAGPNVVDKLTKARTAVKGYYETADFLSGLSYEEPGALYSKLVTGGDRVTNALKTAQRYAPTEVNQIGRTFLQGLFDKATQQGGFNRMDGVLSEWNRMGPETKKILFGTKTAEVEKFILAAKDIGKVYNPSGTAGQHAIDSVLRSVPAMLSASTGNPAPIALEGAYFGANDRIGRMLYSQKPSSLDSLIELSKIMSRPMSISDYYRSGAAGLPMAVRGATSK
jgi:hypothetical protein